MDLLREILLWTHVAAGFVSLVLFWVAVSARKGSPLHIRVGKVFAFCMTFVALSAIVLCVHALLAPEEARPDVPPEQARALAFFLGYLGVVTLALVRHGVGIIRTRRDLGRLRTPFHVSLNALAVASGVGMLGLGLLAGSQAASLFLALSPLGIVLGGMHLRFLYRSEYGRMDWWYAHLAAMIGTGIAAHTAFFVFGAHRLFGFTLHGPLQLVPWLAPTVIGVPAILLWIRHYRRRFEA